MVTIRYGQCYSGLGLTTFLPIDFSCTSDIGRALCKDLDGTCLIETDGYYYAGSLCVLIGFAMLLFYIKPVIRHLEQLPKHMWRLNQ
jgi:hypothetical protein